MNTYELLLSNGIHEHAGELVAAAAITGVPLWVAAAVIEKETGGLNVYGNDRGGVFATPGEPDVVVTEENFAEFEHLVLVEKRTSNGVGPAQITYPDFFRVARSQGLRLWDPFENMLFGLGLVAGYLNGSTSDDAIRHAGKRYNGASAYGDHLLMVAQKWRTLLEGAEDMALAQNGWPVTPLSGMTTFLAPSGKIVYCHPAARDILAYVAWRWHAEIEPIAQATYNEGEPRVRQGSIIAIHAWRNATLIAGTSTYSIHGTGLGMDINGHLHPYEYTAPKPYNSGFTATQLGILRSFRQDIRELAGADILRLGVDFASPRRDGMHVELWGSLRELQACSRAIRAAGWSFPTKRGQIAAYQRIVGVAADDIEGPATRGAVKAVQKAWRVRQTGRWDVATKAAYSARVAAAKPVFDLLRAAGFEASVRGVAALQRKHGLEVDWLVGPATREVLVGLVAPPPPVVKPVVLPPSLFDGKDRFETAALAADALPAERRKRVYLCAQDGYTDQNVAANLGDGAVLLMRRDSDTVPGPTAAWLSANRPESVQRVGSSAAVSDKAFAAALAAAGK